MKYSAHYYAKALVAALANKKVDGAAATKNFLALVRKNNDEGELKKILREAARLSLGEGGVREVILESARPLTASQKKSLGAFLAPHDVVREKIVPDLVAGVKVVVNDEVQFDGSMKAKLDSLFHI